MMQNSPLTAKAKGTTSFFKKVLHRLVYNFFEHNVGQSAAALTYYLLFALFPLLIFLSNVLGLLDLNVSEIIETLHRILPDDVVGIIENYLEYTSANSSHTLMWFSLVFSIWFPMRAARGLMDDVRRAYALGNPKQPIKYMVNQLLYTVALLIVLVLTLLISVLGKNVLSYISNIVSDGVLPISDYLLRVWQYVRFLPAAVMMFAVIGSLYAISLEQRQSVKTVLPGIVAAAFSWLVLSIGFSFYVENFANYSLIYGTLGAVVVLLVWLYMTAVVLILGAELNAAIFAVRHEQEDDRQEAV